MNDTHRNVAKKDNRSYETGTTYTPPLNEYRPYKPSMITCRGE
mgnify:CR=1 FL=1